jgi:predicted dinucleotide-binding enzyme
VNAGTIGETNGVWNNVGRLIRTAGFEPVKVGGIEQSGRLEVGGDLHDLVDQAPQRPGH